MSSGSATGKLALALDVPDLNEARRLIEMLRPVIGVFKVGLELFMAAGPDAVRAVHDAGADCFLDLKLHDIPTTMERAVSVASRLGVQYLTVHAAAGAGALSAARQAAGETQLLAVTVLTSFKDADLTALGVEADTQGVASRWATLARDAGVNGFVTSPHECAHLRRLLGESAFLVTPGIRPADAGLDDQRRTATPAAAIAAGADLLVVGRPIRDADNPVAAAQSIVQEMSEAL